MKRILLSLVNLLSNFCFLRKAPPVKQEGLFLWLNRKPLPA